MVDGRNKDILIELFMLIIIEINKSLPIRYKFIDNEIIYDEA